MQAQARFMLLSEPETVQFLIVNDVIGLPLLFWSVSMLTEKVLCPPADITQFWIVTLLAKTATGKPLRLNPLKVVPAPVIDTYPLAYVQPGPLETCPAPVPIALSTVPATGPVFDALGYAEPLTVRVTASVTSWPFVSTTLTVKLKAPAAVA